eukprot:gnl/TRDRNA2_/TRDRNA2_39991_c0_seq1.p1 gnl/TRDRNA2_/TRDRNA2_39991_c0~~gnl/TRDRNA2_/TRDRNA2_39991_c0_seq1.p1  ORF type:complete len:166 (+),score=32.30 gnl/TRDRNA2_/TRDRNA2_39991_c0_seq1:47-544(+)
MPPDIKALGDQIRALKAKLKASGLKGKEIKENREVAAMVAKLNQAKVGAGIDPNTNLPAEATPAKPPPKPAHAVAPSRPLPPNLKAYGDQIRARKEQLKARGYSGNAVKQDPQVKAMVANLNKMMTTKVPQRAMQAQKGRGKGSAPVYGSGGYGGGFPSSVSFRR